MVHVHALKLARDGPARRQIGSRCNWSAAGAALPASSSPQRRADVSLRKVVERTGSHKPYHHVMQPGYS
eukprot:136262-Rhodomonas_salina.1